MVPKKRRAGKLLSEWSWLGFWIRKACTYTPEFWHRYQEWSYLKPEIIGPNVSQPGKENHQPGDMSVPRRVYTSTYHVTLHIMQNFTSAFIQKKTQLDMFHNQFFSAFPRTVIILTRSIFGSPGSPCSAIRSSCTGQPGEPRETKTSLSWWFFGKMCTSQIGSFPQVIFGMQIPKNMFETTT